VQKSSAPLKGSSDEPVKASGPGRRLESEVKMRTSAEAYLRGSADVSLLTFTVHLCVSVMSLLGPYVKLS